LRVAYDSDGERPAGAGLFMPLRGSVATCTSDGERLARRPKIGTMKEDDPVTQAALALVDAVAHAGAQQRWSDLKAAQEAKVFSGVQEERDDAKGQYRLVTSDGRIVMMVNLEAIL
jgi:hypothetical protein